MEKNNKNKKDNSESNSTNNHHPNQHHSKLTNGNNNRHHTNDSRIYLCTNEFCKGNNCQYKYKEQPLSEDIGCNVHEEGTYITKKNCNQYTKQFPRYPYIDEYYIGNDCDCTYIDTPLSEDIGCVDQTGDSGITTEECEKYTNEPKKYSYTAKICKGNDCISKFKGQPLCDDIGCEVLEEGECMTKYCKQSAKKYPDYQCHNEGCKGKESGCSYTAQPLCEDIGRVYRKECRCLTTVECDKSMNASNEYNCNAMV